jgi:serine/threonine protein kinase
MHVTDNLLEEEDLSSFCILDHHYYDDLGHYTPSSPEYLNELLRYFPADHQLRKHEIWYHVYGTGEPVPAQGFKIHLSAHCASAPQVLRAALPVLARAGLPFKVVVDPFMLALINSKNYSRSGSGKFMTIYPRPSEFTETLEALHQATADLCGPFILSDRRYRESQVVFYRYGGFSSLERLTIQGNRTPMIKNAEGRPVPDIRTPYFHLPDGVTDPFPEVAADTQSSASPLARYTIEQALSFSNTGGVYKGRDSVTGQIVVLKEARPHVGVTPTHDQDAIAVLRNEHRVLKALEASGVAPKVVDYFREWEHEFLVEEFIEGMPLSQYRATHEIGLLANPNRTPESVAQFCARWFVIAQKLLGAIRTCHAENIILGDLSPNNILIDPETLQLRLIDMEAAHFATDPPVALRLFTPGCISPSRPADSPLSHSDDYYAAGSVLYSLILPVQPHFKLSPPASRTILAEITKDYGLPAALSDLVFSLMEGNLERALRLVEQSPEPTEISSPDSWPSSIDRSPEALELASELDGISSHILAETQVGRRDRLWPGDFRLYGTNPLSVAYGAIGVTLFLKTERREIPSSIMDWILAHPVDCSSYPPGLYVGLAGIAWGLAELEQLERAEHVMKLAYESPLLWECPDLFYGMSGIGLASLYFWQCTGQQFFLDSAVRLGDALVSRAQPGSVGHTWLSHGAEYYGFGFGGSGIALFLLYLWKTTSEPRFLTYAIGALEEEISQAVPLNGGLSWPRSKGDGVATPYWLSGNAGIGSVLLRFGSLLGEDRYWEVAREAAQYARTKYAVLPGQFLGLSGIGEFLLDMHLFTKDPQYLRDAQRVAAGIKLFRIDTPAGIMFPGESLLRASLDYGTGSAGIGLYLHRLEKPGPRLFFDFLPGTLPPSAGNLN